MRERHPCCGKLLNGKLMSEAPHRASCPHFRSWRHNAVLFRGSQEGEGAWTGMLCNHRIKWGLARASA